MSCFHNTLDALSRLYAEFTQKPTRIRFEVSSGTPNTRETWKNCAVLVFLLQFFAVLWYSIAYVLNLGFA